MDKKGVTFGVKLQCMAYAIEIAGVRSEPRKADISTEKVIESAEKIYEWVKK